MKLTGTVFSFLFRILKPFLSTKEESRTLYIYYVSIFAKTFLFPYTWHLATNHDLADFESTSLQSAPHYYICHRALFSGSDVLIPLYIIFLWILRPHSTRALNENLL